MRGMSKLFVSTHVVPRVTSVCSIIQVGFSLVAVTQYRSQDMHELFVLDVVGCGTFHTIEPRLT